MKKVLTLALALFAVLAVTTSCSDDDDDNGAMVPQRAYELNAKLVTKKGEALHKQGLVDKVGEEYQELLTQALGLDFYQYVFEYTSVGPDMKTPVRLTGVLTMNPAVYNRSVTPKDVVLYNEYTTAKKGERTSQNELDDIAMLVNKYHNCIAISADLYGWTLTEDKPQAYCCTEITAQETIDCWDAAMEILKELEYDVKGLPVYNVGYSSGALDAMAVQKYVDEKRPDIEFKGTMVGGGPYDLEAIYKDYVETNFTGYVCALPLMIVAYKETFNLPFTYKDVFQDPLASNIDNWILSKRYSTQGGSAADPGDTGINNLIGRDKKINEMLTPAACDLNSPLAQSLIKKFRENSVCGPYQNWQPSKKTQFFVYHSKEDTYITYKVGEEMANYLKDKGCNVISIFRPEGDHVKYGLFVFFAESQALMAGQKLELPEGIDFQLNK